MRSSTTWQWIIALLVVAIVAAIAIQRFLPARSAESKFPPLPPPVSGLDERQRSSMTGEQRLEANSPPFDRVNLGPGTRTAFYRSDTLVEGGYVTAGGLLYVTTMRTSASAPMADYWSLALLNAGRFTRIDLPAVSGGQSGYSSIDFTASSTPQSPVIAASTYDGKEERFLVGSRGATLLAPLVERGSLQNALLSNGDRCVQPPGNRSNPTPYILWSIDADGRMRPLLTTREFMSATLGSYPEPTFVSLSCHSFDGQDFVGVDSGGFDGVVYRLVDGRLTLITRGKIIASGFRRMLIRYDVTGPEGVPTGLHDYLEAFSGER
jgi:hypothetical protein